jgi:hypothetical protein
MKKGGLNTRGNIPEKKSNRKKDKKMERHTQLVKFRE